MLLMRKNSLKVRLIWTADPGSPSGAHSCAHMQHTHGLSTPSSLGHLSSLPGGKGAGQGPCLPRVASALASKCYPDFPGSSRSHWLFQGQAEGGLQRRLGFPGRYVGVSRWQQARKRQDPLEVNSDDSRHHGEQGSYV